MVKQKDAELAALEAPDALAESRRQVSRQLPYMAASLHGDFLIWQVDALAESRRQVSRKQGRGNVWTGEVGGRRKDCEWRG